MSKATFVLIEDLVCSINAGQCASESPIGGDDDQLRVNSYTLSTRPYLTDTDRVCLADAIAAAYSLGLRHATERFVVAEDGDGTYEYKGRK